MKWDLKNIKFKDLDTVWIKQLKSIFQDEDTVSEISEEFQENILDILDVDEDELEEVEFGPLEVTLNDENEWEWEYYEDGDGGVYNMFKLSTTVTYKNQKFLAEVITDGMVLLNLDRILELTGDDEVYIDEYLGEYFNDIDDLTEELKKGTAGVSLEWYKDDEVVLKKLK